jgi:hypothetical protein
MHKTVSGLVAALAVIAAGAARAEACEVGCSPCGHAGPCAAAYERLPDPDVQYHSAPLARPQYYYVQQVPTYTGPGDFAPPRFYQEEGIYASAHRRHARRRQHVLHSLY